MWSEDKGCILVQVPGNKEWEDAQGSIVSKVQGVEIMPDRLSSLENVGRPAISGWSPEIAASIAKFQREKREAIGGASRLEGTTSADGKWTFKEGIGWVASRDYAGPLAVKGPGYTGLRAKVESDRIARRRGEGTSPLERKPLSSALPTIGATPTAGAFPSIRTMAGVPTRAASGLPPELSLAQTEEERQRKLYGAFNRSGF